MFAFKKFTNFLTLLSAILYRNVCYFFFVGVMYQFIEHLLEINHAVHLQKEGSLLAQFEIFIYLIKEMKKILLSRICTVI